MNNNDINNNVENFIKSIQSPNTQKVAINIMKLSPLQRWNEFPNYNKIQLEKLIIDLKPNSPKSITTICYILSLYTKWLQANNIVCDDSLYRMIKSLDRMTLWESAKPNADKKFISHEVFLKTIDKIEYYEECNKLYYKTLFSCIYEGIYNNDMSVLKNLRCSDIHENTVTLTEDNGHVYELSVSSSLIECLKELSKAKNWIRKNRFSEYEISMRGEHTDSVFKIESRNSKRKDKYRYVYYSRLRRISQEYILYNLSPSQLYISGIMYRIILKLNENGISLEEAFIKDSRNRLVNSIISGELKRCNYNILVRNFRENVIGYLDVFTQ